ncbi:SRPBCC family protein [Chitinimonas sp.]|uniref:SRPBCC family protein n=1 Tax=Chitinimonas sp. TaxID=1934313 RepID=UPI002F95D710
MAIVEQRAWVRSSQAAAFEASQDYAKRRDWDPFSRRLETLPAEDGQRITRVTAWHGASMDVAFVAWFPPERAAIRMVSRSRLLAVFAGSWAFLPKGDGMIEVRFRYQVTPHAYCAWLAPLMLVYFRWETRRRLAALKRYLETGG